MKKNQTVYRCQTCGRQEGKWKGRCPDCGGFNTFMEEVLQELKPTSRILELGSQPQKYGEIKSQEEKRITTGIGEFDRIIGGGIVNGSIILIGGSPGIGKSTLILQVAERLSQSKFNVLYVAGEESEKQIKMRGERLAIKAENLYILPETNLEKIIAVIEQIKPNYVIVDSIQTLFTSKLESFPGSISQVRESAAALMMLAKQTGITIFLIGHITKEGVIAGPKALEHVVDTVLYFEGDRHQNHRVIRAVKNRFGATGEIGVFDMTELGLVEVPNPSFIFLQERPSDVPGSAVTVCMEGTRPLLMEVQALVTETKFGTGRRMSQGFDYNRLTLLIAILEKRIGFPLFREDIFINIVGRLQIDEPSADLAILMAVTSSFRNTPIPSDLVILGEVGLAGEIRGVSDSENRVKEAKKLGFKRIVLPASNSSAFKKNNDVRLIGVNSLEEAILRVFNS